MRFTIRSHSNLTRYRNINESLKRTQSTITKSDLPASDLEKTKVYLKSAHSMLLKIGVLKHTTDALTLKKEQEKKLLKSRESAQNQEDFETSSINSRSKTSQDRRLVLAIPKNNNGLVMPGLMNTMDPILNAAEKLLLQTDTIRKKNFIKSPAITTRKKTQEILTAILASGKQ